MAGQPPAMTKGIGESLAVKTPLAVKARLRARKAVCLNTAWTPQLPSTTCVTPKSTAAEISAIASSSLKPLVFHQKSADFAKRVLHRQIER